VAPWVLISTIRSLSMRMIRVISRIRFMATVGWLISTLANASGGMEPISASVEATTLAERGMPSIAAIAPKDEPAVRSSKLM
jgi:hypothetical protein